MILTGGRHMSWINDTKSEISKLDVSVKNLQKFGISVGLVFLAIFAVFLIFDDNLKYSYIFLLFGGLLVSFGLILPALLRIPYMVWMGVAFAIGWIVSRIILLILFYIVILPIGLIARLFGKDFLNIKIRNGDNSYWIQKSDSTSNNYRRMH